MQPENEPEEHPAKTDLRLKIKSLREGKFGSLEKAGDQLGFNKNTISSYEKGLSLPDIDFLFVFADRTGADINELLRLRLASSRYETTRALADAPPVEHLAHAVREATPAEPYQPMVSGSSDIPPPVLPAGQDVTMLVSRCIVAAEMVTEGRLDRQQQVALGLDTWGALLRICGGSESIARAGPIADADLLLLARFVYNTKAAITPAPPPTRAPI